jgi:hypothetical protein
MSIAIWGKIVENCEKLDEMRLSFNGFCYFNEL